MPTIVSTPSILRTPIAVHERGKIERLHAPVWTDRFLFAFQSSASRNSNPTVCARLSHRLDINPAGVG